VPSTSLSRCSATDTTAPTPYTNGASVHPVLKTPRPSRLCMLVHDHRIDRRFPLTKASVHPMPSTSLCRCSSADTTAPTLYTDGVSVHPVLKTPRPSRLCMLLRDHRIDRRFPLTKASVHPVLKTSSWRVSVLIQIECRIDQRCPHLDRRIIRCYCLRCSSSATHPTLLGNGPSVHPTVPRVSASVPTRLTIAPTLAILVPSVHPTVSFSFVFFASSTCIVAST
jgi:hypothetical protein